MITVVWLNIHIKKSSAILTVEGRYIYKLLHMFCLSLFTVNWT